jgi:cytochrome oxidase Cu insertion factor (SCO1/SenC/PrrC family)
MRLLLLVLLLGCSPPAAEPARLGDPFPAFDLPASNGTRVTEADLRGRWTVVELIRSGDW